MRKFEDYTQTAVSGNPLWLAARAGDIDVLRLVELDRYDVNEKDQKSYSPLMYAAYYGHLECVQFLLDRGADVNSQDHGGNTILMGVSFKGHSDVACQLLKAGADPHLQNQQGQTALDYARMFGRWEIVRLIQDESLSQFRMYLDSVMNWFRFFKEQLKGDQNEKIR